MAKVIIRGRIASGLGEGKYFMSIPEYKKQFAELIGIAPFHGTLNVKVDPESIEKFNSLKSKKGIWINGFESKGRSFGGVAVFHANISGKKCAVVFPEKGRYKDILEIIDNEDLRKKLGLKDGDEMKVEIEL